MRTFTCMPREPLVFGQPRSPISSSNAFTSSATLRTSAQLNAGARIEIDAQLVRMIQIARAYRMRVQFDAPQVHDPRQSGCIVHHHFFRRASRKETTASRFAAMQDGPSARASDKTPRPPRRSRSA